MLLLAHLATWIAASALRGTLPSSWSRRAFGALPPVDRHYERPTSAAEESQEHSSHPHSSSDIDIDIDAEADDLDAEDETLARQGCTCRHCKGELTVVGRLKGTPTLRLMSVAAAILSAAPLLAQWWSTELLQLLREGGRLPSSGIPSSVRKLVDATAWTLL